MSVPSIQTQDVSVLPTFQWTVLHTPWGVTTLSFCSVEQYFRVSPKAVFFILFFLFIFKRLLSIPESDPITWPPPWCPFSRDNCSGTLDTEHRVGRIVHLYTQQELCDQGRPLAEPRKMKGSQRSTLNLRSEAWDSSPMSSVCFNTVSPL